MLFASLPLVLKNIFYMALGIFGISFLVAIHEFGHFIFCKLFGIKTPSFSIGFGPRIFEKKMGDTVFTLSAIPLGGYVEIAGAQEVGQGEQEHAQSDESWSFRKKPYWQKLCVLLGGIFFNIMFAYGALSTLFYVGIPKTLLLYPKNALPIIQEITKEGAAAKAELKAQDTIIGLNGTSIDGKIETLLEEIKARPGQTVTLQIERNHEKIEVPITLDSKDIGQGKTIGHMGVMFEIKDLQAKNIMEALQEGIKTTNIMIAQIFKAFGSLLTRDGLKQVGGPLLIGWQLTKSAQASMVIFILLLALISVNLAVLNVFPLPILDGGQVLFYTLEAISGRELPENVRMTIHYISWILALIFIGFIFIKDILLIFSKYFG